MRPIAFILFLLTPFLSEGQAEDNTRIIRGHVFDKATNTIPAGTSVLQYKTFNGTAIARDGTFELKVKKQDTVMLHIPFCFETYYVVYMPSENFKEISLDKKLQRESKKTLATWEKRKGILAPLP